MTESGVSERQAQAERRDVLKVAIGDYRHTMRLKASGRDDGDTRFEYVDVRPINRAFAPMVREQIYDISEMAIMTFLQSKAFGKPLVLLPVALAARFQETALLCLRDSAAIAGPADLKGKRIGVRAYAQTTGVWLRGILARRYGVRADDVAWITMEGAHVADFVDPPFVERRESADLVDLLRRGEVDAIIVGNDLPAADDLRCVFPDPTGAAQEFWASFGVVPINHVLVATAAAMQGAPGVVGDFVHRLQDEIVNQPMPSDRRLRLPLGRAELSPAIALAIEFAEAQSLIPPGMTLELAWSGAAGIG